MTKQKLFGILVILLGVPLAIFFSNPYFPASAVLSTGLLGIFFSPERINDERVQQLKMKAIYTALSTGFGTVLMVFGILHPAFPRFVSDPRTLGAYEFLAGVLLLALGLFYFWREQDAK